MLQSPLFIHPERETAMRDPFRPRSQPAQIIYDGILLEATKRSGVDPDIWIVRERENVLRIAIDYAQKHGLRQPTIDDVKRAEDAACGHTDYAAKWAYCVSDIILQKST